MSSMRPPRVGEHAARRALPGMRPLSEALLDAACLGHDPRLFDATAYPQAHAAIAVCAMCRIHDECLAVVRPGPSWFDGVAGGIVWRNGYKVRRDNTSRGDKKAPPDDGPAV